MTPILTHLAAAIVGGAVWSALVLVAAHWLNTLADRNEVDEGICVISAIPSTSAGRGERQWAMGWRP